MIEPVARTLGGVLEEIAAAAPQRPAVFYEGARKSYAELRAESRRAARALIGAGVRRGDRVGVLIGNAPEWLVVCFAAAYMGATLVPLNTWHKREELEWTLRHARVRALVAASAYLKQDYEALLAEMRSRLPDLTLLAFVGGREGMTWDDLLASAGGVDDGRLDVALGEVEPEDLAFVLYTSGSTAEPKGVLLRHRGVVENGYQIGARRDLDADDRVWLGSPLFYGLGATNALPATLTHSASLVLQNHFDAGRAIDVIESARATVWYGTGNMARAIIDHPSYSRRRVASLEKGNAGTVAEYKRMTLVEMGIARATPAYGLTESYGQCTGGLPDDALDVKLYTNGRPLPGFELLIADPQTRRPLPAGETGLVLLRGHTTDGYLDNLAETARAVLSDGTFDTGDLGRLDREGRFVFHSRLKEVIKSGGISVSPVEVEQLLTDHPEVSDAHVVGVPHPVRGELVVAFVVARGPATESDLRAYVRSRAASFKVPHHVLFRSEAELPRLGSGKVAKHRLREAALAELGTRA